MRAKLPKESFRVEQNGIGLHCEVFGPDIVAAEDTHTILFLPTWSFVHARVHKAQIPYFSDRFRCIAFDPRGNGRSDKPTSPSAYRLKDYVDDGIAILDAVGVEKAVLFGYSISGLVATAMAAHHPERVAAIISTGTNSAIDDTYDYKNYQHFDEVYDSYDGWQKYSRAYWRQDFRDFAEFFVSQLCTEPHSTKQIEDVLEWSSSCTPEVLIATMDVDAADDLVMDHTAYKKIRCPMLLIHGEVDVVAPLSNAESVANATGCRLVVLPAAGHAPQCRFPAKVNTMMRDFLAQELGTWRPEKAPRSAKRIRKRALYLSSPIGLGHGRRDIAVARELRKLHPDLQVDWLAQDPVTRLLNANDERVHPASCLMVSESAHIEAEAGEHELHAFQALRRMDEILIKNFMVFQEVVEQEDYDLVIADEAWEVDHYWHEHPELKHCPIAWFTDFVGWVPMSEGGEHEAFLTADYNAEMIGHVEGCPNLRDHAIFVGENADIAPLGFGEGLPTMREWVPKHFEFSGYIIGEHPSAFGERAELRERFGDRDGEKICIVTVGGSGVGAPLIRRILAAYPPAKARIPELRMIVVTGPRLDPQSLNAPDCVELRSFVPDLDRHLAACDLALVQGGLTSCMELAAAGTPFLYFPLRNHFEQNFHVAHRLDRYGAGRRMTYAETDPDQIAEAMVVELRNPKLPSPVESDGAARAAKMLAELF